MFPLDLAKTWLSQNFQIKIKSDALPSRYLADGLEFDDGSQLKADVIVFATGFSSNMKYMAEDIFGLEIAEQMGDFWTLDEEGEVKGLAKPGGREFSVSNTRSVNLMLHRSRTVVSRWHSGYRKIFFSLHSFVYQGFSSWNTTANISENAVDNRKQGLARDEESGIFLRDEDMP